MAPDHASAMVDGVLATITAAEVPYLLVLGTEMSPDTARWFAKAAPHAVTEVWAGQRPFPSPRAPSEVRRAASGHGVKHAAPYANRVRRGEPPGQQFAIMDSAALRRLRSWTSRTPR